MSAPLRRPKGGRDGLQRAAAAAWPAAVQRAAPPVGRSNARFVGRTVAAPLCRAVPLCAERSRRRAAHLPAALFDSARDVLPVARCVLPVARCVLHIASHRSFVSRTIRRADARFDLWICGESFACCRSSTEHAWAALKRYCSTIGPTVCGTGRSVSRAN